MMHMKVIMGSLLFVVPPIINCLQYLKNHYGFFITVNVVSCKI